MRTCVIFNPVAKGEKAQRFRRLLDAIKSQCAIKATRAPGDGRVLAAEAVREGYDTIVAAGGDGTLNEVLNGISDEPDGFKRARLGVLPLGTVNVLAKEFRLPSNPERAWNVIHSGRELLIDLLMAEFAAGPSTQRRYFAQLAGAGFDARVIELVDWNLKKINGYLAYTVAIIKALREGRPQITATTKLHSSQGELVLIGNGRYYAGRVNTFPKADVTDGRLDVCVFRRLTWFTPFVYVLALLTRRATSLLDMEYFQAESLHLTSAEPVLLELDGELVGQLPASFSVRRQTLRVIAP